MKNNILEMKKEKVEVKRGQVWLVNLGETEGSVQGGFNRPCVIIQNNKGNHFSPTTIIVPLTSKLYKTELPTHALINEQFLTSLSLVLGEQTRTIDKTQLTKYLGDVSGENMKKIDIAIETANGLNKEFDYNKAYELLHNYYNTKALNKKYPDDKMMLEVCNNAKMTYKKYCEEYEKDANEVAQEYKKNKEEYLEQKITQVK